VVRAQRRGHAHGGGGLTDPTFLIGDSDDFQGFFSENTL
jgi:hypothetical protein